MNSDSSPGHEPQPPAPSRQDRLHAEAIQDVRRRLDEQERRAQAEAQLTAAQNRPSRLAPGLMRDPRSPWELGGQDDGFLAQFTASRVMLGLGLGLLGLVISGLFWLASNLRLPIFLLLRALDIATGAQALRSAPWVIWTIWGGIFGGAMGYWLVAPLYGNRENRAFVLLWPLLAMLLTGALLWAFVR